MTKALTTTTPAAHSRIGASSMHRWAECPGSVKASEGMPNHSSKYAEEGTTAHDVAAKILLGQDLTKLMLVQDPDEAAFVSDEMLEAVEVYVTAFKEAARGGGYMVEERFDLSSLHPGLFGTSDGVIYHEDTKELEVWDYKHGAGIAVDVENNPQLMYYGLGALMKTKVPCKTVKLVVCQPRLPHSDGPIRSWTLSTNDLIEFAADLIDYAKATEDPNAPRKSGDHCRFCPAAPLCPTLHEVAIQGAKTDFLPATTYDPAKLAATLAILPAIKAWAKSVEAFAFAEAEHGRIAPGYKLVAKRASRKWKNEDDAKNFIALELGLDDADVLKPSVLRSPAQIEALLKTKADKQALELLVIKESSGSTLAPDSDKRAPNKPSVETEFKVIE